MTTSYRPTGLISYHAAGAYRGYTLFSPNVGDDAYLVDMEGNFVHRWHHPGGIAYGYLLDNGNLLFRDQGSNPPGADHIRELDWDSRLVWDHHEPSLRRHNRLPNGNNLLLLQRDRISAELTRRVRGGFNRNSDPEQMFSDQVVEVTPRRDRSERVAFRGLSGPENGRDLPLGNPRRLGRRQRPYLVARRQHLPDQLPHPRHRSAGGPVYG